jgi:hypothetical protein
MKSKLAQNYYLVDETEIVSDDRPLPTQAEYAFVVLVGMTANSGIKPIL